MVALKLSSVLSLFAIAATFVQARSTTEYCLTSLNCQSNCIDDGPPPPPKGPDPPPIDINSYWRPAPGTLDKFNMVGYWSSWAQYYGEDPGSPACTKADIHLPELINPFIWTHVNYAFVFISNTNFTIIPHEVDDEDLSLRMNSFLKSNNPNIKTSVSLGGWTFTDGPGRFTGGIDYSQVFSQMVATSGNRATFIQSCIDWCRRLGFDGIDIDWEYVGDTSRGGTTQDGANFLTLLQEMRQAFSNEAAATGRESLMITIAAPADPDKFALFDARAAQDYIDWYNLMSYDFYGNWENQVDTTAPVYDTFKPKWSFDSAIHLYLDAGVDPKKINAGLPAYGRVWTLDNVNQNTPGSTGGPGSGYMGWFEILEIMNMQARTGISATNVHSVPNDGAYMTDQWIGFDDDYSIAQKVSLIKSYGLRGGMIWAIDLDTKDYSYTRSVLEAQNSCPANGEWRPTPAGHTAELDCGRTEGPGVTSTAKQRRACRDDGSWDVVDMTECRGALSFNILAQQCIGNY
ncbi:uncharacterized protein PSFLO_01368 [Pseudozyma flocculosa]|uniref:GH18 domain-containing protein n=1 Tax=Pseudozyma flocculosa TaxID=84751 RepID=A0A5C3EWX5_9BASI|nr:uncharacterized protein PSFLO_01368 [Pseudozyma flocculosa]